MKTLRMLCLRAGLTTTCFSLIAIPFSSLAQCIPSTYRTIAYDTLVTGSGNAFSTFTFPKFDPALGTLMSVKVQSVISVAFNFSLENYESIPKSYTVKIGRDDDIESAALTSGILNSVLKSYGPYSLAPSDGIPGSGADYISQQKTVLHNYSIVDSITSSVAPFMGAGTVSFDNNPSTYSFVQGGANYSLLGAAFDTTHFFITYQYCNASMLPSGITVFSATQESNQWVQLNWQTVNEQNGRSYEVEKSTDGDHFTAITSLVSLADSYKQGSYSYKYAPTEGVANKLYFRLKRTGPGGDVVYSDIRTVHFYGAGSKSLYLYPNPSGRFINVSFNQPGNKNWQVEVLAADGHLLERKYFTGSNTARIDFAGLLKAGTYFIHATDLQTQQNYLSGFIVQ